MNEIGKTLAKWLFYMVAVILLGWTASLTVTFVTSALPGMPWYVPYFALVVFDVGMIAWLFVFLRHAQGTVQRGVAVALTGFDFLGVGLMVIAEILLGGQTLTDAPAALGTWAIWGIGVWTVVNVLGVLVFHIGDPEAQKSMAIQSQKDAIWSGAMQQLEARRVHESQRLANELGQRLFDNMLAELLVDGNNDGVPDIMQRRQQLPAPSPNGVQAVAAAPPAVVANQRLADSDGGNSPVRP